MIQTDRETYASIDTFGKDGFKTGHINVSNTEMTKAVLGLGKAEHTADADLPAPVVRNGRTQEVPPKRVAKVTPRPLVPWGLAGRMRTQRPGR